jgi:hypothetical protein
LSFSNLIEFKSLAIISHLFCIFEAKAEVFHPGAEAKSKALKLSRFSEILASSTGN